ncbi:MAG: UMP kinase [Candidatus Paceibacterota bacterium]
METIIISLGGSLIVPEDIDVDFLKDFKDLILSYVDRGKRFVIITGGGKTCRRYQNAVKKVSDLSNDDLDWLGIYSTRLNADFMRLLLGEKYVEKELIIDPTLPIDFVKPIILGGGWKPGNSTDLDAILIAKNVGAKKVINLSNTDYVYDSDPKINKNAKKIEKISWQDYRKLIPKDWNPGLSTPFDPVASKVAEEEGVEVAIMNGKPINNLKDYLNGEKFLGTIIS